MKRVVITGMGVVAPNGIGLAEFEAAIKAGKSGVSYFEDLESKKFSCKVGGKPNVSDDLKAKYFSGLLLSRMKADGIVYGCIAGVDAWRDAGLEVKMEKTEAPDWDSGCIFGSGLAGAEPIRDIVYRIDNGTVKRLGSTSVQQTMSSGVSAHLGGMIGLGNQVTTNAAACSTGSEAVIMGYERIKAGKAKRMLVGGCDSASPYVWGSFDAMRVTTRKNNDNPEKASRPLSATASGFVPGGGAGALVLESLESAQARGARIYAEVIGGYVNSGGQQNGGTMTAPNQEGIRRCIRGAIADANISPNDIDVIEGHLTSTMFDPYEVALWSEVLGRSGADFPYINSLKSMIGHCLSAAGAIESIAAVLEIYKDFVHPSINCEDVHHRVLARIAPECIPHELKTVPVNIVAKSSFGFGDVNSCVIFKKFG